MAIIIYIKSRDICIEIKVKETKLTKPYISQLRKPNQTLRWTIG